MNLDDGGGGWFCAVPERGGDDPFFGVILSFLSELLSKSDGGNDDGGEADEGAEAGDFFHGGGFVIFEIENVTDAVADLGPARHGKGLRWVGRFRGILSRSRGSFFGDWEIFKNPP